MATITQEIKVEVLGTRIPRFKAGSELSEKVNFCFFDTSEGSNDGGDYNYSVKFSIIDPLNNNPTI